MIKLYRIFTLSLFIILYSLTTYGQVDTTYNLLWKIEKEGISNNGYLFGTMHVFDERAFGFADSVMLAIDECEVFALEIHPDTMVNAVVEFMINGDTTNFYKDQMTELEYEEFSINFSKESGLDFEDLENKHPFNVRTFDQSYQGNKDKETFIDMHLFGVARTLGKEIIGLESVENQMQSLFDMKIDQARIGKKPNIIYEKFFMEKMIDAYDKGSLNELEDIIGKEFTENPMMVKRNKDMTQSIMNTLNEKSLFSAVGAGHLIGGKSVISMLEENGYTVTKVSSTFTGIADKYKVDPSIIPWEILVDVSGGYQISFPKNYIELNQSIPSENEIGNDTINVIMKYFTDLAGMENYMIAYNDYPLGFYLESRDAIYEALEQEFETKGNIIESFEDIVQNGNKGRLYRISIQGNSYAILHIFVRGNRVYKLLNQNLKPGEKVANENLLAKTLNLLPYSNGKIKQKKVQGLNLPYFNRDMIQMDSIVEPYSYFNEGFNWLADDPSTGNTLMLSVYGIKDLLSVNNIDSFYTDYSNNFLVWNDTILSSKAVFKDGIEGREILVTNKSEEAFNRLSFWFYDDIAVSYSIYSDSLGVYCDNSNAFINANIFDKQKSQHALLEDKTPKILSGIYSSDTVKANAAIEALSYNTIDSSYAEQLETLFLKEYMSDTLHTEQSEVILDLLFDMSSFDPKEMSYQIAENIEASDYLRSCAISKLYELGDTVSAMQFMFESIPKSFDYWCDVFSPFEASTALTYQYFDPLVASLKHKDLRYRILWLLTELAIEDNEEYNQKIEQNYDQIIAYFENKVDTLREVSEYDIINYTSFFSAFANEKNRDLIEEIDTTGFNSYALSNIAVAKVYNNMPIESKTIDSLISNPYWRFDIQKALIQMDQKRKLPNKLRSAKSVYASKLEYYLQDDGCYDCKPKMIGTITDDSETIYNVYKLEDTYDDETTCVIALVNKTKKADQNIYNDIKAYTYYMDDCNFSQWKQIAKKQLENFESYAY